MASTKFYITAGLPPDDNGSDDGSTLFYITAGLPPDDTAAGGAVAPTSVLYGPLCGPLAGPI
jgi:hypothetical protein